MEDDLPLSSSLAFLLLFLNSFFWVHVEMREEDEIIKHLGFYMMRIPIVHKSPSPFNICLT